MARQDRVPERLANVAHDGHDPDVRQGPVPPGRWEQSRVAKHELPQGASGLFSIRSQQRGVTENTVDPGAVRDYPLCMVEVLAAMLRKGAHPMPSTGGFAQADRITIVALLLLGEL